jgi:hypothetical protein
MKVWTVNHEFSDKFLPIVDGAKPNYGGFDYCIRSIESDTVKVVAGCEKAQRWLPSIQSGILEGCQEIHERGERLCGVQIEITQIYSHELDTSEKVMRRRGRSLVYELVRESNARLRLTKE